MELQNKKIQRKFLDFYDSSQRILPWRDNKNPYYIWVSEIMLQQTRVETVIPYFNRFIKRLPTVKELADCPEDELLKLWEGLGYYSRVRNLQKAAKLIEEKHNLKVPSTKKELEDLPGIGPYTSGAVLSIAYEHKIPAVDGNVLRVFSRLYKIEEDIKDIETKKRIKNLVTSLLPDQRIGDFNQSIMELGATICIPNGVPKCEFCPFQNDCKAKQANMHTLLPFKSKKAKRKIEYKTVVILKHEDQYAIHKRPDKGLLASLYEFPVFDGKLKKSDVEDMFHKTPKKLKSAKHIFTHKEWIMTGYFIEVDDIIDRYKWVTIDELKDKYPIPSAYKVYKEYIGTN